MNRHHIVPVLTVILSAISAVRADDTSANPQEQLKTAIPEAIRLLNGKEYKVFCETFIAPDDLQKAKSSKFISYEELLKTFEREKAADLLLALTHAKNMEPEISSDAESANYVVTDEKFSAPPKNPRIEVH